MPHVLDLRCGACGARAAFEFAEAVQIRKADLPYFQRSPLFEVRFVPGNYRRQGNRHVALFYPGLRRRSLEGVDDLPAGYSADSWAHSKSWYRSGWDVGTLRCGGCGRRAKHALTWPADACYQSEVRGQFLWAFDRR